jgi:DNA mismatch endonuclease, patch repair protein
MPDVFTKEKRSHVMSLIRGKKNKDTELVMIQIFKNHHITGWRRNQQVFGKPDFIFPKLKIALFVDGCFWHLCPDHSNFPKNNEEFWKKKLLGNRKRDIDVNRTLSTKGWRVLRFWEHELNDPNQIAITILHEFEIKKNQNNID